MGGGNGPLNWTNGSGAVIDPDTGGTNVRSDSLVRWMAYAAVAFGAKALNWYCWSSVYHMQTCGCPATVPPPSGRQSCGCNTSMSGQPSPIYQTAREVNADASKWGDVLLGGDFRFASAYNSPGSWGADGQLVGPTGDSVPSEHTLVTGISERLLATAFLPATPSATAYVFVVSKDVSPYLPAVAPRNVSLSLHRCVVGASVETPGRQGRTGFDFGAGAPTRRGHVRRHFAAVGSSASGAVTVTVELAGGGGALVRLSGDGPCMRDAAYGKVQGERSAARRLRRGSGPPCYPAALLPCRPA